MRKTLALGALALTLTACDGPTNISGTLNVHAKVQVVATNGSNAYLIPAPYPASVATDQNGATVAIQTAAGELSFHIPANAFDQSGKINIPGGEIGQAFDLKGEIATRRKEFDRFKVQPCLHHYETNYDCFGHPVGSVECNWQDKPIYGNHDVHQTGYQDTKAVEVNMVRGKVLAAFAGHFDYPEVVTSSKVESGCRM